MAQQLTALAALTEAPGCNTSTHKMAHSTCNARSRGIWCLLLTPTGSACTKQNKIKKERRVRMGAVDIV